MICVNELDELKCHKRAVLQPLVVLLSPYAPHCCEELWQLLHGQEAAGSHSVLDAPFPVWEEKYLTESTKEYPVSVNGKLRTTLQIPLDLSQQEVETMVLGNDVIQKWLEGKPPKKIIFVKGKMINVVV